MKTMNRLIIFGILLCVNMIIAQENYEGLSDNEFSKQENDYSNVKKYRKRLETVDGVEIASSYIEYLDLAFGDLSDRLQKSYTKLADFKGRINKRSALLKEITSEINKRQLLSQELSKKDKLLRTRLIRYTEMKSALQNLADIADYKLNSLTTRDTEDKDAMSMLSQGQSKMNKSESTEFNIEHLMETSLKGQSSNGLSGLSGLKTNSTYTRYIEMAYKEVNGILAHDKQTLIEVIRRLKTNTLKRQELEQLQVKVNSSLVRLSDFANKLGTAISHDSEIARNLAKLEEKIKRNQFDGDVNNKISPNHQS